jgi:hypothetical protein
MTRSPLLDSTARELMAEGIWVARAWGVRPSYPHASLICACHPGGRGACRANQPGAHPVHLTFADTATTSPHLVEEWARAWPGENLAALTGPRSRLVGIGATDAEGLARARQQFGRLPVTPTSQAPSGEVVGWYRMAQPPRVQRGALGMGLRVYGAGDWIPLPGSRTPSGVHRWLVAPAEAAFANLPGGWGAAINRASHCRVFDVARGSGASAWGQYAE